MRAAVLSLSALSRQQRDGWDRLAANAAEPNPFLEGPAVRDAAALLPGGSDVGLLLVEDAAEVHLALPVVRRRVRRVPVRALAAWQHDYCFAGPPLLREGRATDAWDAALRALAAPGSPPWLVLPRTRLQGPSATGLATALAASGARWRLTDHADRPVVRRRATGDPFDGRLSPRRAKALRRHSRRLAEVLQVADVGPVDLAACGRGGEGVEAFLRLEARGWKGRAGSALLDRPAAAEWFRRFARQLDEQGRLETWVLGPADRPAAAQVNARAGRTVFHCKTAYDEDLAAVSPGMQLEVALVGAFAGDQRLELLDSCTDPGPSPSALLYPDVEPLATAVVPLRSSGRLAVAAHTAATRAAGLVRRGTEGA